MRKQSFWFDILAGKMLFRSQGGFALEWCFDVPVSAAGWIDECCILVASGSGLLELDLETDKRRLVAPLEADVQTTRSNDGRADP